MFRLFACDEYAFKLLLDGGQLDARFSAPRPFRRWGIFAIQGLKEGGSFVRQGPVTLAMGVHVSYEVELCQDPPHAVPDHIVLLFRPWWVFHP